jgi:signal transduction histidine kinase
VIRAETPRVEIKTDIDDELYIESNRFISDVFHNILDNTVTHNKVDGLTVAVRAKTKDDGVVVDIADDGSGIPDQIRNDIFDPGVRADGSDGDGIGLYLVRKLVESYGGHVDIQDRSPSGTQFRLWFPEG